MIDNDAKCGAMSLLEESYLKMAVNPLTLDVFPAYAENFQVNTGVNLRYVNVYRNYMETEGRNLSGSTYRGCILTREDPRVCGNITSSAGVTLYRSDFRPLAFITAVKHLYLEFDCKYEPNRAARATSFYVFSYNSLDEVYYKSFSYQNDGYSKLTWQLDDAILTNKNICIAYLSKSAVHSARIKFTLFASGDDPVGKYDTASLERYASQIVQEG